VQADGGCSRRGAGGRVFAEEQDIGDILSGQAFRGRYPLYQIGERPGQIDHKILKPLGTPKRGYSGDDLAYSGVAVLRVMHLGFHNPGHRRAVSQRRRSAVVKCSSHDGKYISAVRGARRPQSMSGDRAPRVSRGPGGR
jgi:hypothetical protein